MAYCFMFQSKQTKQTNKAFQGVLRQPDLPLRLETEVVATEVVDIAGTCQHKRFNSLLSPGSRSSVSLSVTIVAVSSSAVLTGGIFFCSCPFWQARLVLQLVPFYNLRAPEKKTKFTTVVVNN